MDEERGEAGSVPPSDMWSSVEGAERLRIAQRAGQIGAFELIPETGTVLVSPEFCELWGMEPVEQASVQTFMSIVHPDDRERIPTRSPNLPENALDPIEYRIVRPDTGETRWMARRGETIRDEKTGKTRHLGIVFDITDRKLAEERLREIADTLEERVAERTAERDRAWRTTHEILVTVDRSGLFRAVNPAWTRLLGYSEEETVGKSFERFIHPEDRDSTVAALSAATHDKAAPIDNRYIHKDGSVRWISWMAAPEGDLVYASGRDVTATHGSEQQLFESEQRFRLLVQGVRDYAIYMLDREGRVSNWNAGAEAIKGYSASEIIGQHFSRFYTEEDQASGEPKRALATAMSEGKYEAEAWRRRKDGSRFWANVVIDPIYDDAGEHIGFAKITRDATEKRLAQQELENARNELFQSQKLQALGELTGGIAHDFNNLMTVIRGSAELLRRGELSEEKRRRYLDAIVETSDRAATLTSQLLAFGRRQPLKPEVLDLNLRLDAFAEMLGRTLDSRLEVKLDLAPAIWPTEVDSAQLETALLNAAINARDAMPEGGTLTISTRNQSDAAGDMVCIALADTGSGMPQHVLDRAFEPFFTTKAVGKGTGLGLSQIHGFAAQTGGRAEIESEPGRGTTIRILLPRSSKPVAVAADAPEARAEGSGGTVLVVEDNEQVRDFAVGLLGELGYYPIPASSGDEALELLKHQKVDVVFSDVVMPGLSGIELARAVRERIPGLPVLLASGYSEDIIAGSAVEFELIAKPYGAEALAASLRKAIDEAEPSSGS